MAKLSKFSQIAVASGLGLVGGLLLGSSGRNLALSIGLSSGGALFGGGLVAFVYDTKLGRVRLDLNSKLYELQNENIKLKALLQTSEKLVSDLQTARETALQTIFALKSELATLKLDLQGANGTVKNLTSERDRLLIKIGELEGEVKILTDLCGEKEAELQEFQTTFSTRLDNELTQEFAAKKSQLIKDEVGKEFDLTSQAFSLLEEMQSMMKEVYDLHQMQRHTLLSTHSQYQSHHQGAIAKKDEAIEALIDLKDSLELRVRILEQTIADGLTTPEYKDFGVDLNGKATNLITEWVWNHLEIPLKGLGFSEGEELVTVGFEYPKSLQGEAIAQRIVESKLEICRVVGIFEISSCFHDPTTDRIILKYRRERPKPLNDETIYKLGLVPASLFGDEIFKATDHKSKGKPTLRIMSATGGGKGIATKNIVAYFLGMPDWEIWLSDPLDGSEEDYWNCPKVAKSPSEAGQAYAQFIKLHKDRQAKRPAITDRFTLGIFDEFDKQHDDDDKKSATEIMTAIRHTKQRQILIGQSGEVGANHWTWDAMKNCSMLFIEDAIGTALKHDKDLGWSLSKKRELLKQYEKFSEWARSKNETLNLPGENAHRIALLVVGDRCTFLEIPSAHKGILRDGAGVIRSSFDATPALPNISIPQYVPQVKPVSHPEIECPHCSSINFRRHSSVKKPGCHRYSCNDCGKTFVARDNRSN
ncbi:hypothetical protein [Nostoc sp. UHCC 0870]|uniref:hypothetical protein n=1 Tax=Nostoc sp. UHCC 0870 TaxID=2914041 RepID=UPI001EDE4863|nr:hypothetical protein [Nostoc sp. UHCC 0870]UKP01611.1 hypothetical protein L6494_30765 [Nostoc sp. UHCC 0870]